MTEHEQFCEYEGTPVLDLAGNECPGCFSLRQQREQIVKDLAIEFEDRLHLSRRGGPADAIWQFSDLVLWIVSKSEPAEGLTERYGNLYGRGRL